MIDLVEFLRARLGEDERAGQQAIQYSGLRGRSVAESWEVVRDGFEGRRLRIQTRYEALPPKPVVAFDDPVFHRPIAEHIARHDPARVLREVGSKRILVAMHDEARKVAETAASPDAQHYARLMMTAYASALRIMTLAYADHPDYREEWKP